jgi:hypothetical protein
MRAVGVIALGLTLSAAASAASGARPVLRVTDLKPFTVQGSRFHAGEHLRIVITAKGGTTKQKLDASERGAFRVRVENLSIPRCGQYTVRAYGPSGLRASVKTPPYSCGAPPKPAP